MSTTELIRARTGRIEAATAVALYGVYELVRGFGGEDWTAARLHTADIVGYVQYIYWPSKSWSRFGVANDRLP